MNVEIKGTGIYLPEKVVTSYEAEEMAGYSRLGARNGLVKMITGVETRHYAGEDEYCSDIAYMAAKNAIENSKLSVEDIDALIFCSVTQDFAEPATANVVADKLNLKNAFVFDVKNGCNAFLQGMDIADSLSKTGKANNVVIASGEVLSKWVKFDYFNQEELMIGSPVTLSLGDGGGAFVLGSTEKNRGILSSKFKSYPDLWNNNVMWGGGVRFPRNPDKMYIPGTTKKLIEKQLSIRDDLIEKELRKVNWKLEDVDFFATTQAAKWVNKKIYEETGIDESKVSSVIEKWGNVACSNLPLVVHDAILDGKIKEGSKVLFIGAAVGFSTCVIALQF